MADQKTRRACIPAWGYAVRLPTLRPICTVHAATPRESLLTRFGINRCVRSVMMVSALAALLCACSPSNVKQPRDEAYALSPRVIKVGDPVPKGGGVFKVGKPYLVAGKWYTPSHNENYDEVGLASWYGDFFHGRQTANGEVYDMNALSAAHPTLPMPTYARVTNLKNNRSIVVRVNDRGPYKDGRIIDLSRRAAELLGFHNHGLAAVRVQYYGRAPLNGDDTLEHTVLKRQPWATRIEHNPESRPQAAALMAHSARAAAGQGAEAEAAQTAQPQISTAWVAGFQPSPSRESAFDFFGLGR